MWLSFTPTPPPCGDAWRVACRTSSPSFAPSHPPRRLPPSRGGRRNNRIHFPHHPYLTTASDDVDTARGDDDDGGGGGDHALFSVDTRVVIEGIALDDVDGLERMSRLCIDSFYDDRGDDDDDIAEGSSSTSFFSRYEHEAPRGVLLFERTTPLSLNRDVVVFFHHTIRRAWKVVKLTAMRRAQLLVSHIVTSNVM